MPSCLLIQGEISEFAVPIPMHTEMEHIGASSEEGLAGSVGEGCISRGYCWVGEISPFASISRSFGLRMTAKI